MLLAGSSSCQSAFLPEWLMMKAMAKKTAEASIGRGARFSQRRSEPARAAFPGFSQGRAASVLTRIQKYACQNRRTFSGAPGMIVTGIAHWLKVRLKKGRKGALTSRAKPISQSQGERAAGSDIFAWLALSASVSRPRSTSFCPLSLR